NEESWSRSPNIDLVPSLVTSSIRRLPDSVLIVTLSPSDIDRFIFINSPVVRLITCGLVVGPSISITTGDITSPSLYTVVLLPLTPNSKGNVIGNVNKPV